MIIKTLDEYHDEFLENCKKFYSYDDRNKDWFNPKLSYSIVNNYQKYLCWTFLLDDNEDFVAMSCIQDFGNNEFRVLTRNFIDIPFRQVFIPYTKNIKTIGMHMLEHQIDWLINNYNTYIMFVSMDPNTRINSISKFTKNLNKTRLYGNWVVDNDYLYQTYHGSSSDKFQWKIVTSTEQISLPKITRENWRKKYDS